MYTRMCIYIYIYIYIYTCRTFRRPPVILGVAPGQSLLLVVRMAGWLTETRTHTMPARGRTDLHERSTHGRFPDLGP